MNRDAFDQTIYRNWAAHFGCPAETLGRRGTAVLPLARYAGQKLVSLWYIGEHAFIQLDPAYTDQVDRVLAQHPPGASLVGDDLQRAWGAGVIASRDTGLVHYLFPADYRACPAPPPFALRQLTQSDAEAMSLLHQACPQEALSLSRRPATEVLAPPATEEDWRTARAAARGVDLERVR